MIVFELCAGEDGVANDFAIEGEEGGDGDVDLYLFGMRRGSKLCYRWKG